MGIDDSDCDCEMPLDIDDDSLESYCASMSTLDDSASRTVTQAYLQPSRITGFLAFSRLCRIAGRIVRAMSALEMKQPRSATELRHTVDALEIELTEWLRDVPDAIKFSANNDEDISSPRAPHLTMCVISYILHAGCVINLHRYGISLALIFLYYKKFQHTLTRSKAFDS
jgi:hypothetical protein